MLFLLRSLLHSLSAGSLSGDLVLCISFRISLPLMEFLTFPLSSLKKYNQTSLLICVMFRCATEGQLKLRKAILMSTYALLEISVISRFHLMRNCQYDIKLLSLSRKSEIYIISREMSSFFQILDPMSVILLFAHATWFIHPSLAVTTLTFHSR